MIQEILINKEDTVKTEEELKNIFIRNILEQCGFPIDDYWPEDIIELSVKEKIKLKELLKKYDVDIIHSPGEGVYIYIDKELIGSWKKIRYALCTDMSVLNPLDRVYAKMYIEEWSVFDQEDSEDSDSLEDSEYLDDEHDTEY